MAPTGRETVARNSRLVMRLLLWADQKGGWKVFDSSTGFFVCLADQSVLSPDGSLVCLDRWQALTTEQRRSFAPGAQLGWLLIPRSRLLRSGLAATLPRSASPRPNGSMRMTCSLAYGSTWQSCVQVENPAESNRHALRETTITAGQRRRAGAEQQKTS